ncbi:unnamed protein product, partial [Ectocarpus sp. 8 AP-2014]
MVDRTAFEPIHHAAADGDTETLKNIVASGIDVDTEERHIKYRKPGYYYESNKGYTPLQVAFESGSIEAARVLIDLGADVNRLN